MESWRRVWREGFAPLLSTKGLEALRKALLTNDGSLIQGSSASALLPIAGINESSVKKLSIAAACAIGYCGWKGEGLSEVDKVQDFFFKTCFAADRLLGVIGECRHFVAFFDATQRDAMRSELLPEVSRELANRQKKEARHKQEAMATV